MAKYGSYACVDDQEMVNNIVLDHFGLDVEYNRKVLQELFCTKTNDIRQYWKIVE